MSEKKIAVEVISEDGLGRGGGKANSLEFRSKLAVGDSRVAAIYPEHPNGTRRLRENGLYEASRPRLFRDQIVA